MRHGLMRFVIAVILILMPMAIMIVLTVGLMLTALKIAVATLPWSDRA